VWVCLRGFVMCGCMCVCGFCNVCVCKCGFVICGLVCVWLL